MISVWKQRPEELVDFVVLFRARKMQKARELAAAKTQQDTELQSKVMA